MPSNVYVVTFPPATQDGGVGGFQWFWDSAHSQEFYETAVREYGDDSVVRLVKIQTEASENDAITAELEHRSDEHEMTLPAIKQHIPANTYENYRPTGGLA